MRQALAIQMIIDVEWGLADNEMGEFRVADVRRRGGEETRAGDAAWLSGGGW
ncbi:hypothetical protein HC031_19570 [Planosporangium thailandense]|uniref:Uncharacterized protein n=1 Tax=Planosporangium thailandense TaxID=765197 RepID=A0ABX0Y3A6_9ACTN|nr:hypothetical protein [Planosporangium thailandense]NJC71900.1 hypothetical protein [Planosporangium thailandense]